MYYPTIPLKVPGLTLHWPKLAHVVHTFSLIFKSPLHPSSCSCSVTGRLACTDVPMAPSLVYCPWEDQQKARGREKSKVRMFIFPQVPLQGPAWGSCVSWPIVRGPIPALFIHLFLFEISSAFSVLPVHAVGGTNDQLWVTPGTTLPLKVFLYSALLLWEDYLRVSSVPMILTDTANIPIPKPNSCFSFNRPGSHAYPWIKGVKSAPSKPQVLRVEEVVNCQRTDKNNFWSVFLAK